MPWSEKTSANLYRGAQFVFVAGLVILVLYSVFGQKSGSVLGASLLIALATTAVSMLAGFIFGLPRYGYVVVNNPGTGREAAGGKVEKATRQVADSFAPSNNLEQVSDWLTKLLLGAGLVQLGSIGKWLGNFIEGLSRALVVDGATAALPAARLIAGSILALYGSLGFLFAYITTTVWYRQRLVDLFGDDDNGGGSGGPP
jgi:hypothetical protein